VQWLSPLEGQAGFLIFKISALRSGMVRTRDSAISHALLFSLIFQIVAGATTAGVYCREDADENAVDFCRDADACKKDFNTLEDLPLMDLATCRAAYYVSRCNETGGMNHEPFNPECLPLQLSSCVPSDNCAPAVQTLWWYAGACGMPMLRLKYGPDRLVIGRRNLFRRLCAIIFENLAAFTFPFAIAISVCLVFYPKKPKPPSDKPKPCHKRAWEKVKKKLDVVKGKLSPLIIMGLAPVVLFLAMSTAGSTLVRFWTEINKYYTRFENPRARLVKSLCHL
jgi:hypothetical protein